jgi:peptidoglycan/LPS O-acetylase OafA/YrhL
MSFFHRFGWIGVDLFFVLSGFLIGSQVFDQLKTKRRISLAGFYLRRAFRILPSYWIVLFLYWAWPLFREKPDLAPLWRFFTFTHNLDLDRSIHKTFSQSWSLCVEEHFYLIFPLLTILIARSRNAFRNTILSCATMFLGGMALRYMIFEIKVSPLIQTGLDPGNAYQHWIYYPTHTRLDGLLAGVSLAMIQRYCPDIWKKLSASKALFLLLSFVCLGAAYEIETQTLWSALFVYPLISLGFALCIPAAASSEKPPQYFGSRTWRIIADLAFPIYLTHKQIFHLYREALISFQWQLSPITQLLTSLPLAIISAWTLHTLIEKPFLTLRNKLLSL